VTNSFDLENSVFRDSLLMGCLSWALSFACPRLQKDWSSEQGPKWQRPERNSAIFQPSLCSYSFSLQFPHTFWLVVDSILTGSGYKSDSASCKRVAYPVTLDRGIPDQLGKELWSARPKSARSKRAINSSALATSSDGIHVCSSRT
jgi:hypothetical protein